MTHRIQLHLSKTFKKIWGSTRFNFSSFSSSAPKAATIDSSPNDSSSKNYLSHGQPTFETHPEFFTSPLDILPGIRADDFRERRRKLGDMAAEFSASKLRGKEYSQLIIIPAASKTYMTENIPYPFRQNSNFFYLTGSYDPEALLVLTVSKKGVQRHTLFLNESDAVSELWDGRKTSPSGAMSHFGIESATSLSSLESFLKDFMAQAQSEVVLWCEDRRLVDRLKSHFLPGSNFPIQSPKPLIDSLRLIKSPSEIDLMRHSASIASGAFEKAMAFTRERTGKGLSIYESHIWAVIDYESRLNGAERLAYPPVVAAGNRANVIHYVFNSNPCGVGDLMLVDAGCEFFGYCSDITRTWPLSTLFDSVHQKDLYELVLNMQIELIQRVEPGMTLEELFRQMGPLLINGLKSLGIIRPDVSSHDTDLVLLFCPHHVSHFLGLDVHDTSSICRSTPLTPGMVLTIEPGIYIPASSPRQEKYLTKIGREFRGIGIRVEDDVVVTESGHEVLSAQAPKTIEEIRTAS